MIRAGILTIGDEIMIGQIVDTNSAWISSFLDLHGYAVTIKMTVGDSIPAIIDAVTQCLQHADVLITTGGLGPTNDDLTVDALTQYFSTHKVWHEETWQRIIEIMHRVGKPPSELHRRQCYLPASAEIIANDRGSAPGMIFRQGDKIVASVPGVPAEMKHLLGDKMIDILPKGKPVLHRFIRTAGEGETTLADMIRDIESSLPEDIKLAYLPSFGFVTMRLTTYNMTHAELIHTLQSNIIDALGRLVYSADDTNLSQALGNILRKNKQTMATAESCTGGYLAHQLTSVAGSSDYFVGSVNPYSYELKTQLLDIPSEILLEYGAVSQEVVTMMAENLRKKLNVDWVLSTSGIAGPGGATATKPVGTIWIACAGPNGTKARLLQLRRDRIGNIESTAVQAMILLWKMLGEQ